MQMYAQFPKLTIDATEVHTWFERDRQHVELRVIDTQRTVLEFWDGEVSEFVEDGFINPKDWHGSMFAYAVELGLIEQ